MNKIISNFRITHDLLLNNLIFLYLILLLTLFSQIPEVLPIWCKSLLVFFCWWSCPYFMAMVKVTLKSCCTFKKLSINLNKKIYRPWTNDLNKYTCFILVPVVAQSYKKLENRHCYYEKYGSYETLDEATAACNSDKSCSKVYDDGCDNAGPFSLCPRKSAELNASLSCLYVKKTRQSRLLGIYFNISETTLVYCFNCLIIYIL